MRTILSALLIVGFTSAATAQTGGGNVLDVVPRGMTYSS